MENTDNTARAEVLIGKAKEQLIEDMRSRNIAAIIWNLGEADFHYIPEITLGQDDKGIYNVMRVTGLYAYGDRLYAIAEDTPGTAMSEFYDRKTETPPVVVTLTQDIAEGDFGDPADRKGFTLKGTDAEWLTIADCYFEALNEQ